MENAALIVVDVQNDFLPGGSLAVPEGDQVVPVVKGLVETFDPKNVIFTADAHPANHGSFASAHEGKNVFDKIDLNGIEQVLWPDHCVVGTDGQKFAADLTVPKGARVIEKGIAPGYDSYSGFKDASGFPTRLGDVLCGMVSPNGTVYIAGLATDYCVKATALDAAALGAKAGFKVRVVIDGCRGVTPGTTEHALAEMADAGIEFVQSSDLATPVQPLD